ncbi:TetR/AcrR family transcriptional regulator [Actinomycetospora sp. NBRC 106378]|uniref:TetR/AcrR family transcriptional regulator n=1 Tax=Actinomycetospora sp. NBRC 106378 TaxID=3032208 RepID=UPI0024A380FF|nr:TetR/AcrR family transcriptional regulator [Actinomycetospora sp. NBRC 106378]GLZ56372.1 TetR family transcriptional regulator [Actinomycetospora sp. NBRC 106378]
MASRSTYHHGNLRAALVEGALALVAERGIGALSVAEVARRVGVSSGAPYRHFAHRPALLAATAVEMAHRLTASLRDVLPELHEPLGDLDAVDVTARAAAAYTRFTIEHGAGLDLIFSDELHGLDDRDLLEAGRAVMDALVPTAMTVTHGDARAALRLIERQIAAAHGYAALLRTGFLDRRHPTADDVADHVAAIARSVALTSRDDALT